MHLLLYILRECSVLKGVFYCTKESLKHSKTASKLTQEERRVMEKVFELLVLFEEEQISLMLQVKHLGRFFPRFAFL
jgi:hypothetical protein